MTELLWVQNSPLILKMGEWRLNGNSYEEVRLSRLLICLPAAF
jgi:hypothetical protein